MNNVGTGHVEARGHIPNVALPGFGQLAAGPWAVKLSRDSDHDPTEQLGYVFFEHDDDGHVRWDGNAVYSAWRAQQAEVCDGIDLDDLMHDK